jgi:hypothetical protein
MVDLEDQVVVLEQPIIKLQLGDQELNLVNLVYLDHVVMEMTVVEIQVLQDRRHVKLGAAEVVELVQLQPMLVDLMVELVELVEQVI